MNIYVIVEGELGSKKIYESWATYINNQLQPVSTINEVKQNNFFVFSGGGQNEFKNRVRTAVEDVNSISVFDRLVVAIDSEEKSYDEKLVEVRSWVEEIPFCRVPVKYIIQHFCIETWFLGNESLFSKKPRDEELIEFLKVFDIRTSDPELLPDNTELGINRSKFAYRYLLAGVRDINNVSNKFWNKGFSKRRYSKKNPDLVLQKGFYNRVKERFTSNNHIKSFNGFIEAFS
jgi:hypothetical protein